MERHPIYAYTKQVELEFSEALQRAKEALLAGGFGILFEIDFAGTLREKTGVEMEDYAVLGACNPHNAKKVLMEEAEAGLLLPCNVAVYKRGGNVFVSTVMPSVVIQSENRDIKAAASDVENMLKNVVDSI